MRVIRRLPDRGYLDTHLWVPKPYIDVEGTKRALTYEVTDSYTNRPKWLYLWQETDNHLLLPRAFWDVSTLTFPVIDCRPRGYQHVAFKSRIQLDHLPQEQNGKFVLRPTGRDVQQKSFQALVNSTGGTLQLACGKGKTVVALHYIAEAAVPAIIMLDNTNLLEQWAEDIEQFLEVPGGVGLLVGGKKDWEKAIVLGTYQSAANWADTIPEDARRWFGTVVWDEGHHVSAPTYAKSAPLFYGHRISLTATPERDDGFHIISDLHIGPILYKDLTPEMKPRIAFFWTGMELDMRDPNVASRVLDVNGEIHTSKLNTFFGQWTERTHLITAMAVEALQAGRKALVLSNSVDEVVNLMALWTYPQGTPLYTDIPVPTNTEVGETLTPIDLPPEEQRKLKSKWRKLLGQMVYLVKKHGSDADRTALLGFHTELKEASKKLGQSKTPAKLKAYEKKEAEIDRKKRALCSSYWQRGNAVTDFAHLEAEMQVIEQAYAQYDVHRKIQSELARRQKEYINGLVKESQNGYAGFLTYGVNPAQRQKYLDEKPINFAITKYGKEGMDCQALDTVILSSLFSQKNGLQQLMGRPTRPLPGKKEPLIVLLVDNVGQCIGMSQKLQGHLRSWPREEGGPYDFILVNYPATWTNRKKTETLANLFGPSSTQAA